MTTQAQFKNLILFSRKVITNKVEKGVGGYNERNYYNNDCIDYTLIRESDKIYTLRPGKNTLHRFKPNEVDNNPFRNKGQLMSVYPGRVVKKDEIESFVYALPVMNSRNVKCEMRNYAVKDGANDSLEINALYCQLAPEDTICAVRSGIACQDVVGSSLYVYHDDGTIAIYSQINKFVKHQDRIIAGQPIGTLMIGKKSVRVTIVYIDKSRLHYLMESQNPYSVLCPIFRTSAGDIKISSKQILTAVTDDDLITKEMTKKEKKQYKK